MYLLLLKSTQVFLAMNAINGTLMAVKQVEIPSGVSHNEARKKGMVEALEREIELLKGLQHENIVQYLGKQTYTWLLVIAQIKYRLVVRRDSPEYFP